MNRRRLLIAFAIVLPIAIFGAAKWSTRWRPVVMGNLPTVNWLASSVQANEEMVAVSDLKFDLKTGAKSSLKGQMLGVGTWSWERNTRRREGDDSSLVLNDGGGNKRVYDLPGVGGEWDFSPINPIVRYTPAADRLEMISNGWYYRWRWSSRHLERSFEVEDSGNVALTRDGETIINQTFFKGTSIISTHTGRVATRVPLRGLKVFEALHLSPFGRYGLYKSPYNFFTQHVVDTRTGRVLWSIKMDDNSCGAVFSPDETQIVVPLAKSKIWQIRALPTGQILRTLPLVPNVDYGAFSPDNSMLYSVANDKLYRQRAR